VNVVGDEFRMRIRYRKIGRLRYLSHLEVVRTMERSIRRAGIPFAVTKGFSPHMRLAFGWALPVGTGSLDEYLDVIMTSYWDVEKLLSRLKEVTPSPLAPLEISYLDMRDPSPTTYFTISCYEVYIAGVPASLLQTAADAVMTRGNLTVIHKKKEKQLNLADMVVEAPQCEERDAINTEIDELLVDMHAPFVSMTFATRVTERGCLRASLLLEEILKELPDEQRPLLVSLTRVAQIHEKDALA
jgi:radical SAM-linked protein